MNWLKSLKAKLLSSSDPAPQLTHMECSVQLLEAGLSTRELASVHAMHDQGRINLDTQSTMRMVRLLQEGGPELQEFRRSLDMYDQAEERLDEPRAIYEGMTQRDMNICCDSVRAFILDGDLNDRKPTSAKQVKALLRDFFRAGLHAVDAQDALDDESADIIGFFKKRTKAHKEATPVILSAPLDAPEVITVFALEMLNGKRVGKTYLEWRGLRTT